MSTGASRLPRVVLAEDNAVPRYTITLITENHCELLGEAEDGAAAVELAGKLRPDLVLLDVSMPLMGGFAAARLIRERFPDVHILVVSNDSSPVYIEETLRLGAHGYVVKGSALVQLPQAIQDALNGKFFRPA